MPRIAQEEIERLKREIPVQRLAEARGIKLKPHGKDLIGLCVFHKDTKPSLVIDSERNIWNCLGACAMGGSNIDWVMKDEGVEFRQAVEILLEGQMVQGVTTGKIAAAPKLKSPVSIDAEDREHLMRAIEHYHQILKQSPEALSYLEKRGLNNPEMIDRFKIGYSNRTLGNQLPEKNQNGGAAIRERLTKTGIFRETGHELFNGAVVFPIFNESGQVTEIYGRKILDNLREGTAYHLYLPGPHEGIFNLEALKTSKKIILCEAIIDALTFWNAGFHNVTASYGVNGFTPDHLEAFKKNGVERVFIAYDRDDAGDNAAEKLSRELIAEGFECLRILFPRGMDANEYGQKVKPASKAFDLLIRNAAWVGGPASKASSLRGHGIPEVVEALKLQEEPKAATKWEKIPEESQGLEGLSQPLKETKDIFPLDAKRPTDEPPKPVLSEAEGPEPAPTAPVSQPLEPITEIKDGEIIISLSDRR